MHLTIQNLHVMGRGRHLRKWFAASLHQHTELSLTPLRQHWEADRGHPFNEKEWNEVLSSPTYIPRNARFRLIQHYILQRAHLTPAKINRFFHRADATCPRCQVLDDDLLHMLLACPSLHTYWHSVCAALTTGTGHTLAHTWEEYILHFYLKGKRLKVTSRFLDLGILAAKRLITKCLNPLTSPP